MSKKFRNFRAKYQESSIICLRNFVDFRVKYQESSIGFENLVYLQSIENKCKSWNKMLSLFEYFFARLSRKRKIGVLWRLQDTVEQLNVFSAIGNVE